MHEPTFPSRMPGWSLIAGVALAGLLGAHISLVAFADFAMQHPGSWVGHLTRGEGWQAFGVLVRCAPTGLFAEIFALSRHPATPYQRWCGQWWRTLDRWSRGAGGSFIGATMLLMTIAGTGAYLCAMKRLVPQGASRRRTTTYATRDDLQPFLCPRGRSSEEMLKAGALPLGRTVPDDSRGRSVDLWLPLAYRRQHVWVLGVTGVGKTSAIIKRWLASDAMLDGIHAPVKMSTVAVDVKDPDLWEFAARIALRYQRRIIRWAPMSPDSMGHNFLDYVHTVGDTLAMAETILSNDPEYNRKDPFWRQTELNMLSTTIQLVCEEPPQRLMDDLLREKMANVLGVVPPPRSLAFILGLSHLHPSEFVAYIERVDGHRSLWRDRYSKVFHGRDDRTIGTWQGLQNVLVIFRDPDVIAATSRSDFHLSVIARQPTTLIIGLPRAPGSRRQVLTALFLRQLLQTLAEDARGREPQALAVPVTLLLDELGVVGLIPTFQDFIATYRDLGVSFVIATQDRAQLVDIYGEEKADAIIANLHTRIIFGRDLRPEQAEEICRALGETIVPEPGVHYEHANPLKVARRGTRVTYQVRRLLEPNELRALPEFRAVAVLPGDVKAHVELLPVHTDWTYKDHAGKVSTLEALRHDIRMDRLLGRLTAAPQITGAAAAPELVPIPTPEMSQRLGAPHEAGRHTEAGQQESPDGTSTVGELSESGLSGAQMVAPVPDVSVADAFSRIHQPAKAPQGKGVSSETKGQSAADGARSPATGSAAVAPLGTAAESSQGIGAPLVSFVTEVLHGLLRDERLASGSARGWVFEEKRGEFLVPWGFLRDWAFKTHRRFTDLEASWLREGLLRGHASLTAQGRAITCLIFTKTAALQLPAELQQTLAQMFAKVSATAVRLSTTRIAKGWGPDLVVSASNGETDGHAQGHPAKRGLVEFVHALEQAGIHFIGHAARDQDAPVYGRWRATAKDGSGLLLVERNAAKAIFESVGVSDPSWVLGSWKQASILYLVGEVRAAFYIRRTYPEGREFLALRWSAIQQFISG